MYVQPTEVFQDPVTFDYSEDRVLQVDRVLIQVTLAEDGGHGGHHLLDSFGHFARSFADEFGLRE